MKRGTNFQDWKNDYDYDNHASLAHIFIPGDFVCVGLEEKTKQGQRKNKIIPMKHFITMVKLDS